jgi:hypothetical protein
MSGDVNRNQYMPPCENQMPLTGDASQPVSDATQNSANALLFRDDDLMGGITALDQNNLSSATHLHDVEFTGLEEEETMSFAPDSSHSVAEETELTSHTDEADGADAPAAQPAVTPQRIAEIITNLDSPAFRTRDRAQADIEAAGPAALPQLLQAIANPPSLEVQRRAEMAVRRINDRMSTQDLLALRDPAQRNQAIRNGFAAPLNEADTARLSTALESMARSQMESRIGAPGWLNAMDYGWKKGELPRIPTEETVRQFDRMATPEGRRQATDRLAELTTIISSPHVTEAERETISNQISAIGRALSPETIANGRIGSRMALAEHLQSIGGDANRIQQLAIEAHNLNQTMAPGGQQGRGGGGVLKTILGLGLDQNPAFMQNLARQPGGAAAVQTLQQYREQIRQNEQNQNNWPAKQPQP